LADPLGFDGASPPGCAARQQAARTEPSYWLLTGSAGFRLEDDNRRRPKLLAQARRINLEQFVGIFPATTATINESSPEAHCRSWTNAELPRRDQPI